ncbi:MAG: ATP synthase F1 subunit delta [Mycoplasma sp.]
MHFQSNANEYARAIYEIAVEKNSIQLFHKQILVIQKNFFQHNNFYQLFTNSTCQCEIKKDVIKNIYGEYLDIDLLNFLYYLIDQRKTILILSIIVKSLKFLENELNVLNIKIFTPFEIDDETINIISQKISEKTLKETVATTIIDPNLIGGIRVQYDSKLLDNSISTKLNTIKQNMKRGK